MDGVFEDEVDCKRILREINLLRKLHHPYVVNILDVIEPKNLETFDSLLVVLELAESDLKKVIKSAIHLQIKHISTVVYNLLAAVKYLHSANVLHRDLKPANVLVNEDCSVKICDFGLERSISGVESASCILSARRLNKNDEETKASESGDDALILGGELAKIHHKDDVATDIAESTKAMSDLKLED